jgi:hypothetical protein
LTDFLTVKSIHPTIHFGRPIGARNFNIRSTNLAIVHDPDFRDTNAGLNDDVNIHFTGYINLYATLKMKHYFEEVTILNSDPDIQVACLLFAVLCSREE